MEVPYLDLSRENDRYLGELVDAAQAVITRGWFVLGPEVEAFEQEFAEYVGAQFCVGVGNGLDAMTLVLRAWGIGAGDEVIVPSNTYVATWLAVTHCGATVVPVEPDEESMVIGADAVRAAITDRTVAVLPVHLYGYPVDMAPIMQIAADAGIKVLEDAAQAHGATVGARPVGSIGHATAWSFYPTKNLGALGDGGAVTTDDPDIAHALRVLRNYGTEQKYVSDRLGTNSRLDELQAALLRVKLRHLEPTVAARRAIAARYGESLATTGLRLPSECSYGRHAWHLYVVRHERRDHLLQELARRGVGTVVHYPVPPHLQPAYHALALGRGAFPIAERIHEQVLSLPLAPYLSDGEQDAVVGAVCESVTALD